MSNLQWFRMYHRIIDDEKIRLIAFEDRWHFIAVLCLKADGLLDEPDTPLKWRKVAVKMGIQSRELDEIKRRLSEVGLVDAEMQPIAWDDLQYRSDTSTDRVRKYRDKTRPKQDETERNVSVTPQETETDTEAEKKKDASVPKGPSVLSAQIDNAIDAYAEMAERAGLAAPRIRTTSRRQKVGSILKAHGAEVWAEALARVETSEFLCGSNDRGFKASLDFLCQPSSFAKVLEGQYGTKRSTSPPKPKAKTLSDKFGDFAKYAEMRNETGPGSSIDSPHGLIPHLSLVQGR